MSRVIHEWPTAQHRKYHWEQWCDGQMHELTRGVDFECSAKRLRTAAHNWAERHGFEVRTRVRGDTFCIQALNVRGEAAE